MPIRGPLLGYNENVVYRGCTLHIQTEDLGPRRQTVTSHLFADGGRIAHSARSSYAKFEDDAALVERIRTLMKEQHAGVLDALRSGQLDAAIDGGPVAVNAELTRSGLEEQSRMTLGPGNAIGASPPPLSSQLPPPSIVKTQRRGGVPLHAVVAPEVSPLPGFGARFAVGPRLDQRMADYVQRRS